MARFKGFSALILVLVVCLLGVLPGVIAATGDYQGMYNPGGGGQVGVFIVDNQSYSSTYSDNLISQTWVNGTSISTCATTATQLMGIDTDGSTVWGVQYNSVTAVYYTDLNCGGKTTWSLNAANGLPGGIHYNNGILYITDDDDNKVYRYWSGNKTYIDNFDTNAVNDRPWGITGNTTYLYIDDRTDLKVYQYELDGTYVGELFDYSAQMTDSLGMDINATSFFIFTSTPVGPTEGIFVYEYTTPVTTNVITTTLVSPSNNSLISDVGANFSASYVTEGFALKNATYYFWRDNGTSFNVTTFALNPATSNVSIEYIDSFDTDGYIWNVLARGDNVTGTYEFWATENSTFNVVPFSKLSESWVQPTSSGSTDLFTVNISLLSGYRLSSIRFYYNGTPYSTGYTEYETNKYYVTKTLTVPTVAANTNVTFYWNVTLETGESIASTTSNQTIQLFSLDNCSANTFVIFNFTMVDEDTQALLVGATENTSLRAEVLLTSTSGGYLPLNYTGIYTKVNPAAICTNVNLRSSTYLVDAIVEYGASGKFTEYYHIQDYTLTNLTGNQNITLYNLNSSKGQEFKITYKDSSFNTVPGALIQVQRKYIDEGIFKTVEIPLVGSSGYTIAHLIRNDAIYNLIVINNGVVLDSFTNIVADCQNPSISECTININSFSSDINIDTFKNVGDFSGSLTFNKTTRVVSSTFIIPSGVSSLVTLNVSLYNGLGDTVVCEDSLLSAGGTLSCTVPNSFGNATIVADVYNAGELRLRRVIPINPDSSGIYGGSVVFLGLIFILFFIGISITDNPMTTGIVALIGFIALIALNLINSSGWIGGGAIVLWLIVSMILIFIKGSNR